MKSNHRVLIPIILLLLVIFNLTFSYAYWASEVFGSSSANDSDLTIGDWFGDYTPIYTIDDFVTVVTTNNNTGKFILATDLDFENALPSNWNTWSQTANSATTIFRGEFNGNGKSISNLPLSAYQRGIFPIVQGGSIYDLNLDGIVLNFSTSSSTTSGLLIGRIQGTGTVIDGITINNSSIASPVLSGGLIGYALDDSIKGNALISNIAISHTSISGSYNSTEYGNGGLIGTVNNFDLTLENIQIHDINVTSTTTGSSGGIIGATIGTNTAVEITNATVSESTITANASNAGGAIGTLVGTGFSFDTVTIVQNQITSTSNAGGMIATSSGNVHTLDTIHIVDNAISGTTNAGGAVATVAGNGNSFADLKIEGNTISSTSSSGNAGGAVALLNGNSQSFTRISVADTSVSSANNAGGVIGTSGLSSGGSATAYHAIKVLNSTVHTSRNSNTGGAGGVIGHYINNRVSNLNDIYVQATITSTRANVAGIIGHKAAGTVTINRAVVYSSIMINDPSTSTDRGAAGIIGRNQGTTTANDTAFTGHLKARIVSNQPYVGILRAIGTDLAFTNSRSVQVSYYRSASIPEHTITDQTWYDRMRGQKTAYEQDITYTSTRDSLSQAVWQSIYPNITNSSLWVYNPTTRLFELNL